MATTLLAAFSISALAGRPWTMPAPHKLRAAHVPRGGGAVVPPPCSAVPGFVIKIANQAIMDFNVTGLSVGVVCNHSVVFTGGFGMADVAAKIPASADTLFQVASNSKAFTAMVALQMQQEGLLDIDAPARDANPNWRVLDSFGSASITPRDMMSHRTGLPRHDQVTFAARNRSAMMETLPYLPYDKQVRYQPGEYNNMMFAATGFLEEAVSGNSWEHEVQTRIFDRLNMTMSSPTMGLLRPDQRAKFARCYTSSGGERDLDSTAVIDCLNADAAGPCGSVISSVADFVKWQAMHMRQAIRACAPGHDGAPFFSGPRDEIECPPGRHSGPISERPAQGGEFLLQDSVWKEYIRPNTIFPDWNAFGTYSLGLWWEQLYPDPSAWCLHHAGDLPGMASKEAMLPWLGHSVVVLSNANQNPARFAVVLQILDFLTGNPAPEPSWTDLYLKALKDQHNEGVATETAWQKQIASARARPGGAAPASAADLVGHYAHPAYGNCSISAAEVMGRQLTVSGCASIWGTDNLEPWVAGTGVLQHLFFNTFAVTGGAHLDVGAGTPTITFHSTAGDGVYDRFESPLEPSTVPIVFAKAGYCGQGVGYSAGGGSPSKAFSQGVSPYSWPLPERHIFN